MHSLESIYAKPSLATVPSTRNIVLEPIGNLMVRVIQIQQMSLPQQFVAQLEIVLTNRDNKTFRTAITKSNPVSQVFSQNDGTLFFPFNETIAVPLHDISELNLVYSRVYKKQKDSVLSLSHQSVYLGSCFGYKTDDVIRKGQLIREAWHKINDPQHKTIGMAQLSIWFEPNPQSEKERNLDTLIINDMKEGHYGSRIFSSLNVKPLCDEINLAMDHVNRLVDLQLIEDVHIDTKPLKDFMIVRFRRTGFSLDPELKSLWSTEDKIASNPNSSIENSQLSLNPQDIQLGISNRPNVTSPPFQKKNDDEK